MYSDSLCYVRCSLCYVWLQPLSHVVAASIARVDGGEEHAWPIDGAEGL